MKPTTTTISEALQTALQHRQAGDFQAAEVIYRQILDLEPNHIDALYFLGLIAYHTNNYEEAVAMLKRAIAQRPWSPEFHCDLGTAYFAMGKFPEAVTSYEEALRLKPQWAETYYKKGLAFQNFYKFAEARASYQEALKLNLNDAGLYYNLAATLQNLEQFEEALACYREVLRLQPDWAAAYYGMGVAFQKLNKFEEALANYHEALRLQLDYREVYLNMGLALQCLGRFEEALAIYQEALRRQPNLLHAYFGMGSVLTYQNRLDEAEYYFHQSANLTPTEESAQIGRVIYFNQAFYQTLIASNLSGPKLVENYRKTGHFTHVVVVTCDLKYFYHHGLNYLQSFAQNAEKEALLHLHVVNPDAEWEQKLTGLLSVLKLDNICVTSEQVKFNQLPPYQETTYYTCVRFLHLSQWLTQYQKPIVCTDIDGIVEKPFTPMLEETAKHDVSLILSTARHFPWLDISANFLVTRPTGGSTRFFSLVRNYLLHFIHRGELYWYLDQLALFCVLKMLERFGEPPVVNWLREDSQQFMWHLGHAHKDSYKLQEERFTRYSWASESQSSQS